MTTLVDPLAAVIAIAAGYAPLREVTTGRIAARHEFSLEDDADGERSGWPTPARALTLTYAADGVQQDTATCGGMHRLRLDTRCYGPDQPQAAMVYLQLDALCRAFERSTVALPDGNRAVVMYLWPESGPQAEKDPETRVDYLRVTILAGIAREAVAED